MNRHCRKCGNALVLVSKVRKIVEPDFENMSDGQISDWFGEEASGDYTNHGIDLLTYKCNKCGETEYFTQ